MFNRGMRMFSGVYLMLNLCLLYQKLLFYLLKVINQSTLNSMEIRLN